MEIAQIVDYVKASVDQLQLEVKEGGNNFSGGQRQRLAIARALVGEPAMIILDDSLSALDYATESKLRNQLLEYFEQTTLIIVSQRISSIQSADHILVLENGKMDEQGTHDSLVESSEVYRNIYTSQTSGPETKEEDIR